MYFYLPYNHFRLVLNERESLSNTSIDKPKIMLRLRAKLRDHHRKTFHSKDFIANQFDNFVYSLSALIILILDKPLQRSLQVDNDKNEVKTVR